MMKILALALLVSVLMVSGCVQSNSGQSPSAGNTTVTGDFSNQGTTTTFTLEDVALHNSQDDCWMVVSGKVYDVTEFVPKHPGGKAILQGCGKDATSLFETRPMGSGTPHSERARSLLGNFYIGDLA